MAKKSLTENNMEASMLELQAQILIRKSEYKEAIEILEKILPKQGHNALITRLMMIECYSRLGEESKVNPLIESVKRGLLTSTDNYLPIDNIFNERQEDSHPTQKMILRGCLSGVLGEFLEPDETVTKIREECSLPIYQFIEKLASQETLGEQKKLENQKLCKIVGLPLLVSCLEDLRKVSGADKKIKAKMEAWCLNDVGLSYDEVGEQDKAIKYLEDGIQLMENNFWSNASEHQVHGRLLNNIGAAYYNLGQFMEAEKNYLESVKAYEKATDWLDDDKKEGNIRTTKKNLRKTRKKIKKLKMKSK